MNFVIPGTMYCNDMERESFENPHPLLPCNESYAAVLVIENFTADDLTIPERVGALSDEADVRGSIGTPEYDYTERSGDLCHVVLGQCVPAPSAPPPGTLIFDSIFVPDDPALYGLCQLVVRDGLARTAEERTASDAFCEQHPLTAADLQSLQRERLEDG